jgi:hypothetical protein
VYYFTNKNLYIDIQKYVWSFEMRYCAYCAKEAS